MATNRALLTLLLTAAAVTVAPGAIADTPEAAAAKCKESGDHATCAAAGAALEAAAPDTALELYTASCTKRPDQCFTLISYAQRMLRRKDGAPRGAWVLEKGCELKSAMACSMLAGDLEDGEHGLPQDATKAERLYERACELGSSRSCLVTAVMIEDARGVKRDAAKAQKYRQRSEALDRAIPKSATPAAEVTMAESACRKGQDAPRCVIAATSVQETDAVKAEELFRIGCAADKSTCGLWGFAVDRYRRDDASRGSRILEQGCVENSPAACMVLGELHHLGFRSVQRNETRASELYQRACDASDALACRISAARLRAGVGLAKNPSRADEMVARSVKIEEEQDRPARESQETFVKDAAVLRARDAYQRELERRRADWRAFAERARARSEARAARLAAAEQGQQGNPPPGLIMADGEASKVREAAIRRMGKSMFP